MCGENTAGREHRADLHTTITLPAVAPHLQGITPVDSEAAAWLRRTIDASSVRAVLNKAETPNTEARARVLAVAGEAAGLGFGEPIAVSAATGEGIDELFHAISPALDACSSRAAACDPTSNHRGSEAAASVSGRAPGAVSGEDRVAAFRLMGRGPRVRLPAGVAGREAWSLSAEGMYCDSSSLTALHRAERGMWGDRADTVMDIGATTAMSAGATRGYDAACDGQAVAWWVN